MPNPKLFSDRKSPSRTDAVQRKLAAIPAEQLEPGPAPDPLALMTKRELANLLAVDPWTIDRWRKSDDFPVPVWLSGTTPRWRRADIETWLATRQQGGRAPDYDRAAPCRTATAGALVIRRDAAPNPKRRRTVQGGES